MIRRPRAAISWGAMARPPKILLPTLPAPARRVAGFWLLTLSLWLASAIALFR